MRSRTEDLKACSVLTSEKTCAQLLCELRDHQQDWVLLPSLLQWEPLKSSLAGLWVPEQTCSSIQVLAGSEG